MVNSNGDVEMSTCDNAIKTPAQTYNDKYPLIFDPTDAKAIEPPKTASGESSRSYDTDDVRFQNNTMHSDLMEIEAHFLREQKRKIYRGVGAFFMRSENDKVGGSRDKMIEIFEDLGGKVYDRVDDHRIDLILIDPHHLDPKTRSHLSTNNFWQTALRSQMNYKSACFWSLPNPEAARVILTLLDKHVGQNKGRNENTLKVLLWDWVEMCRKQEMYLDAKYGWVKRKVAIEPLRQMLIPRNLKATPPSGPASLVKAAPPVPTRRTAPPPVQRPSIPPVRHPSPPARTRAAEDVIDFSIAEPSSLNKDLFAGIAVHVVVGRRFNSTEIARNLGQTIKNHGGKAYAIGSFEHATHLLVDSYYCDPEYYPAGEWTMKVEDTLIKPDACYLRAPFPSIANKAAARLVLTLVDRILRYNPARKEEDIVVLTFDWPSKCLLSSRLLMDDDRIGARSWGNCRIDVGALRRAAAEVATIPIGPSLGSVARRAESTTGSNTIPLSRIRTAGNCYEPLSSATQTSQPVGETGANATSAVKRKRSPPTAAVAPRVASNGSASDESGYGGDRSEVEYVATKRRRREAEPEISIVEQAVCEPLPPVTNIPDSRTTSSAFRGVIRGWQALSLGSSSEGAGMSEASQPSSYPGSVMVETDRQEVNPITTARQPIRISLHGAIHAVPQADDTSSIVPEQIAMPALSQGLMCLEESYALPRPATVIPATLSSGYPQEILPYEDEVQDSVPLIGDGLYDVRVVSGSSSWDYSSTVRLNNLAIRKAPSAPCFHGGTGGATQSAPTRDSALTVEEYVQQVLQISLGGYDSPRETHLHALERERRRLAGDIARDLRIGALKYEVPLIFRRRPTVLSAVCLSSANASRFDKRFSFYLRGGKTSEAAALHSAIEHMEPISSRTCLEYYLYSRQRLCPDIGGRGRADESSDHQYDGDSDASYASDVEETAQSGQSSAPASVPVPVRRVTAPLPMAKPKSQAKLRPGKAVKKRVVHQVVNSDTGSDSDSSLSSCSTRDEVGPLQRVYNVPTQTRAVVLANARKPSTPPTLARVECPDQEERVVPAVKPSKPVKRKVNDGIRRQRLIVHPSGDEREDILKLDAQLPGIGAGDECLDEKSAESFTKFAYCHWDIPWPELAQKYLQNHTSAMRSGTSLINHYSANHKTIHEDFSRLRQKEQKHSYAVRVPPINKCPGCGGGAAELLNYSTSGSGRREKLCPSCIADFSDERPLGDRAIKQFFADRRSKVSKYEKALSAKIW